MKKFKLLIVGVIVATAAALFGVAAPAQASTYLGGVSVWNACVYQHGTPSSVVLVENNVNGWRCKYDGGWNAIYDSVDLSRECRRAYSNQSAYAAWITYNDPYSWGCYRP